MFTAIILQFAVTPSRYYSCNTQQADFLCIVSGVLFLLIGSYWPIAYCWKSRQSRNFTLLGCYFLLLLVLIVSCLAALVATVVATCFHLLLLLLLWVLLFLYFRALVFVVCVVVAEKLVEIVRYKH